MIDPTPIGETKRKRYKSAFRSRRRADRLPAMELKAVQSDFVVERNSEDVGRTHLLPRAEAQDAVLIGHGAQIRFLVDQVMYIRKQMGIAISSTSGPFLLESGAGMTARESTVRDVVTKLRRLA